MPISSPHCFTWEPITHISPSICAIGPVYKGKVKCSLNKLNRKNAANTLGIIKELENMKVNCSINSLSMFVWSNMISQNFIAQMIFRWISILWGAEIQKKVKSKRQTRNVKLESRGRNKKLSLAETQMPAPFRAEHFFFVIVLSVSSHHQL